MHPFFNTPLKINQTDSVIYSSPNNVDCSNPVEILRDSTGFSFTPSHPSKDSFSYTTPDSKHVFVVVHTTSAPISQAKPFHSNHELQKGVLQIHPNGSFTYSPGDGTNLIDTGSYQFIRGDQVIRIDFVIQVIDYKICATPPVT